MKHQSDKAKAKNDQSGQRMDEMVPGRKVSAMGES